jgi:Aspartyl/Asparaginyl beta-hydroxylase
MYHDTEELDELHQLFEFIDTWRDHTPVIPDLYQPTPTDIRRSLGYLTLQLPFDIPHQAMLAEAKKLREFFVAHRSGGEHRGWRSLCLHGISSVHTENHDRYGFANRESAGYDYTDISRFCPVSTAFFRDVLGYDSYDRVRFMLLEPGGYILPHEDVDWKQLGPINIALNNPVGCEFAMEHWGLVPFSEGTANMLAVGHRHAVFNNSNEDRYHIIVHGTRANQWQNYILDSYSNLISKNV